MELIILILAICIILLQKRDKDLKIKELKENTEITHNKVMLYPYRKKYLLTKNEYYFYNELRKTTDAYNYIVCPKVRLEDFIEVTDKTNISKYRGYIKSRHVDFILCDNKLNIIAAIELDDKSHNSAKAQKTDEFKNNIFNTINIKLFRITYKLDYNTQIKDMITSLVINQTSSN